MVIDSPALRVMERTAAKEEEVLASPLSNQVFIFGWRSRKDGT
jgi:hypothetical protein